MKNLAGTWAALPKDMSGRGAYDGYNTNKSNINPNELMAAITGPNGGYQSKTAGIKPDATLPTATSSNAPAMSDPEQSKGYNEMVALLEQSNRIQSEQADALSRIRQNTAV
jgi:hypothetical protein